MSQADQLIGMLPDPAKLRTRSPRRGPAVLGVVGLLLITILVVRDIMLRRYVALTTNALSHFTPVAGLGYYEEARPQFFASPAKPWKHAVLLLHGYSASPEEFNELTHHLKAAGVPYYAPLLTGYGLQDFRLLHSIQATDWLRDAEHSYAILDALAEEVSVVGQSAGASPAIWLASHHPVKHLVLVGPNLAPAATDVKIKRLINMPVIGRLGSWLMPVFAKPQRPGRAFRKDTLDPVAAANSFSYPALPTQSLRAQWEMQDQVDIRQARFQDLALLYGRQDITVDNEATVAHLQQNRIAFTKYMYANSGHNVLQDYQKDTAVGDIMTILTHR